MVFLYAWEQRELANIFGERIERSALGELLSVTINSGVQKTSDLNRHDNSSQNKSNYKLVVEGDIAYNSMRMWQGASGRSPYNGIVSPAYTVIFPRENVSTLFFSYIFKRTDYLLKFQDNSQGITSDTWNLKYPAFSKIKVFIPSIDEQQKIGLFFKQLDDTITLHQCGPNNIIRRD